MSVLVVNRKHYTGDGIYIGRAMPRYGLVASPLANPYRIGRDGTREEVIEKYRGWLRRHCHHTAPSDPVVQQALIGSRAQYRLTCFYVGGKPTGEHIVLICWCKQPGKDVPCHGDVLRDWLYEEMG